MPVTKDNAKQLAVVALQFLTQKTKIDGQEVDAFVAVRGWLAGVANGDYPDDVAPEASPAPRVFPAPPA